MTAARRLARLLEGAEDSRDLLEQAPAGFAGTVRKILERTKGSSLFRAKEAEERVTRLLGKVPLDLLKEAISRERPSLGASLLLLCPPAVGAALLRSLEPALCTGLLIAAGHLDWPPGPLDDLEEFVATLVTRGTRRLGGEGFLARTLAEGLGPREWEKEAVALAASHGDLAARLGAARARPKDLLGVPPKALFLVLGKFSGEELGVLLGGVGPEAEVHLRACLPRRLREEVVAVGSPRDFAPLWGKLLALLEDEDRQGRVALPWKHPVV